MDRDDRDDCGGEGDDLEAEDRGDEGRIKELPDEDVQVGPELTDRPRSGSTEPPD